MKRSIGTVSLSMLLVLAFTQFTGAQERDNSEARTSPNASVSQTIGTVQVSITYGRPSVRDREIYGGLVPYGEVWRTGANEATTISFSEDVVIEGEPLEAGTYGLFTIPGENEWVVIFNNVSTQWGAFDYDSDEDALRVTVAPEEGEHREQLMFFFEDVTEASGRAVLHWAELRIPFAIETS